MVKYLQEVVSDSRFVVIDITCRVNRDLSRRTPAVPDGMNRAFLRSGAKAGRTIFGQRPVLMNAEHTVHKLARDRVAVNRIDCLRDDRYRSELADCIGSRE